MTRAIFILFLLFSARDGLRFLNLTSAPIRVASLPFASSLLTLVTRPPPHLAVKRVAPVVSTYQSPMTRHHNMPATPKMRKFTADM